MGLFDFLKKDKAVKPHYDLSSASAGLTESIVEQYNQQRPLGPQAIVCHAPFKNLYFGHHGNVVACCYNRLHFLGNIKYQTIEEIWNGDKANQLRDSLKKYDFSLGCHDCLSHIIAGNIGVTKAKQYDERGLNSNGYPTSMEFELDNTCNLECTMCSGNFSSLIRTNREHRPPLENPYGVSFLEQLKQYIPFLEEVKFYGGEPFLIEIYYQIIDLIIEIKPSVRISIQTNGTVLNNRVKDILAKTNVHLNISIDSLIKETYEQIRVNAKLERVLENLNYFNSYCKSKNTFIGISVCAMQQNWQELPAFVSFCNAMEVPINIHNITDPITHSLKSCSKIQLREIGAKISSASDGLPNNSVIERKNKKHLDNLVKQLIFWAEHKTDIQQRQLNFSSLDAFVNSVNDSQLFYTNQSNTSSQEIKTQLYDKLKKVQLTVSDPKYYQNKIENINLTPDITKLIIDTPIEELARLAEET